MKFNEIKLNAEISKIQYLFNQAVEPLKSSLDYSIKDYFYRYNNRYTGKFDGDKFKIWKINYSLIKIRGKVEQNGEKNSVLHLKLYVRLLNHHQR